MCREVVVSKGITMVHAQGSLEATGQLIQVLVPTGQGTSAFYIPVLDSEVHSSA